MYMSSNAIDKRSNGYPYCTIMWFIVYCTVTSSSDIIDAPLLLVVVDGYASSSSLSLTMANSELPPGPPPAAVAIVYCRTYVTAFATRVRTSVDLIFSRLFSTRPILFVFVCATTVILGKVHDDETISKKYPMLQLGWGNRRNVLRFSHHEKLCQSACVLSS